MFIVLFKSNLYRRPYVGDVAGETGPRQTKEAS
jgi:hypothetical protein